MELEYSRKTKRKLTQGMVPEIPYNQIHKPDFQKNLEFNHFIEQKDE